MAVSDKFEWSSVVKRGEWGARTPREVNTITLPVQYVFIHHSAGNFVPTSSGASKTVKAIQNFHMDDKNRKWADIGYTYLVGEDGKIYEGRGWDIEGAHTYAYNKKGIGICVLGNFNTRLPNAAALNAVKSLIAYGVENEKIRKDYILKGHRDVKDTECPGQKLYEEIRKWPNFS